MILVVGVLDTPAWKSACFGSRNSMRVGDSQMPRNDEIKRFW